MSKKTSPVLVHMASPAYLSGDNPHNKDKKHDQDNTPDLGQGTDILGTRDE